MKVSLVFVVTNLQIAKHQNRFFMRLSLKMRGSYRLSVDCLTKEVLSSDGPPDTSQSRLFPLVLHHAGELVQSSVVLRAEPKKKGFVDSFMLKRLKKCLFSHFLNPQNHLQNPDRVFQSSTIRIKPQFF
jgi:hypothetical protein